MDPHCGPHAQDDKNEEITVEKVALKECLKQAFKVGAENRGLERIMISVAVHYGIGQCETNLKKKLDDSLKHERLDDIVSMVKGTHAHTTARAHDDDMLDAQ